MTKRRIRCHETGKIYRNQKQIARELNLNYNTLTSYFRRKIADQRIMDVGGYTFDYFDLEE